MTKTKRSRKPKTNLEKLRAEFAKLLRNAFYEVDKKVWLAAVKELAEKRAKGKPVTAQQWVDAAKDAVVKCGRCSGTGLYQWGASVNGVMQKSGPCYRCQGTGKQGQEDFKRNWYYDNHRPIRIA